MSKLNERAMLVTVRRRGYSGTMIDQGVSEEARQKNNAKKGAGGFVKVKVHPSFLDCVTRPLSRAGDVWKQYSLPWDDGRRIMSNLAQPKFAQEFHAARLGVDIGKIELLKREDAIHEEAQRRLGKMYNRKEYPSIEEIADSFSIEALLEPVPDSSDFRVKLSDATVKDMVKELEKANKERLEKVNQSVFKRVFEVVETLAKTLKEYEPKTDLTKGRSFRDSLIGNVQRTADLLPVLNVTLDTRVDDLRDELITDLTKVPAEALKASTAAREEAVRKAEKLLAKISGYMA